jgi:hypothetical protein
MAGRVGMTAADEEPGAQVLIFLLGAVLGAVVVGIFWWALEAQDQDVSSGADRQPLADVSSSDSGAPSAPSEPSPARDAADGKSAQCAEVYTSQAGALGAVNPAMRQWEVHIGAMNQLVDGEISLQQANRFWNETRRGAQIALQKFAAAHHDYEQRTARCGLAARSISPEIGHCVRVIAARNRTVHAATVALDTWRVHAEHMEMLRRGEMTPAQATRLWVKSWHRGNRQVRAYHNAHHAAVAMAGSHQGGTASGTSCAP